MRKAQPANLRGWKMSEHGTPRRRLRVAKVSFSSGKETDGRRKRKNVDGRDKPGHGGGARFGIVTKSTGRPLPPEPARDHLAHDLAADGLVGRGAVVPP